MNSFPFSIVSRPAVVRSLASAALFAAAVVGPPRAAVAQVAPQHQTRTTRPQQSAASPYVVTLDECGNAHCDTTFRFEKDSNVDDLELDPAGTTKAFTTVVSRIHPSQVVRDVTWSIQPDSNAVRIQYVIADYAHYLGKGQWKTTTDSLPVQLDDRSLNMLNLNPQAIVTGITGWDTLADCSLSLPKNATNLEVNKGTITYTLAPAEDRKDGEVKVDVDFNVKKIMACMCKVYGDERFPNVWVARAVVNNSGQREIKNLRVQFSMNDYANNDSDDWKTNSQVLAGETVTLGYSPSLQIDRVLALAGQRQTTVKMVCEYTVDGKTVQIKKEKRIELLASNQVDIFDRDQVPYALASMVTPNDPVVQQMAGMVSSQIPGGLPSAQKVKMDGVDPNIFAKAFMNQLFVFMHRNNIVYQTPPGNGGVQNIKFPRDVLRNHAGTCVDLAVLYASVCEAVGLNPVLLLPDGHCFPAIYIPADPNNANDKSVLLPIEATKTSPTDAFEDAVEFGEKKMNNKTLKERVKLRVNVFEYRAAGVPSFEFTSKEDDLLKKAGYAAAPTSLNLEGDWVCTAVRDGQKIVNNSHVGNGRLEYVLSTEKGPFFEDEGAYTLKDTKYEFIGRHFSDRGTVTWIDANRYRYREDWSTNPNQVIGAEWEFTRVEK